MAYGFKKYSSTNQPSGKLKSQGRLKGKLIRNFRSEFFQELLKHKSRDQKLTRTVMLHRLADAIMCDDKRYLIANDRARMVLQIIDTLTTKDFDYEDFSSRLQIILGGKNFPFESKLANVSEDVSRETNETDPETK